MKRRSVFYILLIALTLTVGICLALYLSNVWAAESAQRRARTVLVDSANEDAETFAAAINGQFQVLHTAANTVSYLTAGDETRSYLDAILGATSFSRISYAGLDGVTDDDGIYIGDRAYFQDALIHERAMQRIRSRGDHEAVAALAIPVKRDGAVAGVLCGYYTEEALRLVDNAQPYGGEGYSFITDSQGFVVFGSRSENSLLDLRAGDTIDALAVTEFEDGFSYPRLREMMEAGESGTFMFRGKGQERVVAFVPFKRDNIPDAGWYIFNGLSSDALFTEISANRSDARTQMWIALAFTVAATLILLALLRQRRRELNRMAEETRMREERFRIAVQQSERSLFEYDIAHGSARMETGDGARFGMPSDMQDFVAYVMDRNIIARGSWEALKGFFNRVQNGDSPVMCDLQMTDLHSHTRWYRFCATTQFSDKGKPRTAIISFYDCTEQREREMAYARWQQELEAMPKNESAVHEWNLTRDFCESEHSGEVERLPYPGTFEQRASEYAEQFVFEEDREAYLNFLDRTRLLGAFHSGVFDHELEYRDVISGGLRWVRISVRLVPYPDSTDVKAYLILKNIDKEKREELELRLRSQTDPMTGVLNRVAFQNAVERLLQGNAEQTHVLMMIDIDHFKNINDTLGHDEGDNAILELVKAARSVLRTTDIFGRVGGDEFMICLPDIPFESVAIRRAEQIRMSLYRHLDKGVTMTVSVGIAVSPRDGTTFSQLYKNADIALYYAKKIRNSCEIYSPEMKQSGNGLSEDDRSEAEISMTHALPKVLLIAQKGEDTDGIKAMLSGVYDVVTAASYRDAIMRMDRFRAQLCAVLLDMDASFAMEVLRAHNDREDRWQLPLMAIIGEKHGTTFIDALRIGAVGAVHKPVSAEELQARVEALNIITRSIRAEIRNGFEHLHTLEESRFRTLMNVTRTALLIYDPATRKYDASLMKQLDFVPAGFDGRYLSDVVSSGNIVSDADMDKIRVIVKAVLRGEDETEGITLRFLTKQYERRWFHVRVIREEASDALVPKLLVIFSDVHDAYTAEHPDSA